MHAHWINIWRSVLYFILPKFFGQNQNWFPYSFQFNKANQRLSLVWRSACTRNKLLCDCNIRSKRKIWSLNDRKFMRESEENWDWIQSSNWIWNDHCRSVERDPRLTKKSRSRVDHDRTENDILRCWELAVMKAAGEKDKRIKQRRCRVVTSKDYWKLFYTDSLRILISHAYLNS